MSTEFIEELDALQSVYSNLTIRTVSRNGPEVSIAENLPLSCDNICMFVKEGIQSGSSASNQDYHAIIQLSCSPQYNSASFVSTDIQISIPSLYPSIRPVFEILKSSGLCDEGREMKEIVHRFIEDSQPEECLLFQLISVVHDFLDSCSIGECSICAEEIAEFIYQGLESNNLFAKLNSHNCIISVTYLLKYFFIYCS